MSNYPSYLVTVRTKEGTLITAGICRAPSHRLAHGWMQHNLRGKEQKDLDFTVELMDPQRMIRNLCGITGKDEE